MSVDEPDVSAKVAPNRARIEWPTGHADVVPERATDLAAEIRTIHGRRSAFRSQPPTPSIARVDHGRARAVTDVMRDLERIVVRAHKCDPAGHLERAEVDQRIIAPGWGTRRTNGHFAVCARREGGTPLLDPWLDMGPLTPEAWRAYARVRICRPNPSHAIRWAWTPEGLRLSTQNKDEALAARELVPGVGSGATGTVALSDEYLWPCRGVAWRVAVTAEGHAILLEAGDVAVIVMGLREFDVAAWADAA